MRVYHTVSSIAVLCALFCCKHLYAQVKTVELHSAEIVASTHDERAFASFTPDSLVALALPGASAGELLAMGSTLNLRQYGGYGSLITGALRGLSADHFAVTWNGVPIHSATLGLTDLSTLPGAIAEATHTQSGALTSDLPVGAAAGRLHLGNHQTGGLVVGAGYDNLLNLRNWGGLTLRPRSAITLVTRYQRDRAENRFSYQDPYMAGSPQRTHEHNAFNRDALLTEVQVNASARLKMMTAIWLQRSQLELPEILGSHGESFDLQRDSLIRISTNARYSSKVGMLDLVLGRSAEGQRFTSRSSADAPLSIDSRITAIRNFASLTFSNDYKGLRYRLAASLNDETARSGSHPNGSRRLLSGISLLGNYALGGWATEAAFRIDGGQGAAVPVPELRISRKLGEGMLSSQLRRVFRYPDLNELFWTPGGNPDLTPEDGLAFDLGWKSRNTINRFTVDYSITAFRQEMAYLIVWSPNHDGLLAQNLSNIVSTGGHFKSELTFRLTKEKRLRYTLDANVQHTAGLSELEARFFPVVQGRTSLAYTHKRWFASLALRYVADDWNPKRLNTVQGVQDAVLVADAMAGINITVHHSELSLSTVLQNVGDVMDHRFATFATPGRVFSVRIQMTLIDHPIQLYKAQSP